jgi:hypothetical protein
MAATRLGLARRPAGQDVAVGVHERPDPPPTDAHALASQRRPDLAHPPRRVVTDNPLNGRQDLRGRGASGARRRWAGRGLWGPLGSVERRPRDAEGLADQGDRCHTPGKSGDSSPQPPGQRRGAHFKRPLDQLGLHDLPGQGILHQLVLPFEFGPHAGSCWFHGERRLRSRRALPAATPRWSPASRHTFGRAGPRSPSLRGAPEPRFVGLPRIVARAGLAPHHHRLAGRRSCSRAYPSRRGFTTAQGVNPGKGDRVAPGRRPRPARSERSPRCSPAWAARRRSTSALCDPSAKPGGASAADL